MQSYKMEVSKKEDGKYTRVGEVEVFYPLLSELGLSVEPSGKDESGFPTYSDEKVQYTFDAVLAAVKANARNKLVSGTATLKEGNKIAETVEELLATSDRNGEALKARREFIVAFRNWMPTIGKSAVVAAGFAEIADKRAGIVYQSDARKAALIQLLTDFAAALDAEKLATWQRFIVAIVEDCGKADPLA